MGGAWRRKKEILKLALLRNGKKKKNIVRGMELGVISNEKRETYKEGQIYRGLMWTHVVGTGRGMAWIRTDV
jgi:hypothetical protein